MRRWLEVLLRLKTAKGFLRMNSLSRWRKKFFNHMSELYDLIILPEAELDIRNIVMYIAMELAAPQAALNLQRIIEKEIRSLSYMPDRIRLVDEQPWRAAGIRRTRVKNYFIYFFIDENRMTVYINAVIYSGRDQTQQLRERNKR